jgi:peptide deformylase
MAILDLVYEGDPRLRQKAQRIRTVDEGLLKLAEDMHETMHAAPGVGLAGPQIGVMRRIVVIYLPENYEEDGDPELSLTLINPEIIKMQGRDVGTEGCLSIPGWVGDVPRATKITVRSTDIDGRQFRFKAEGILARVVQHEVDHLDGILYIDRVEDKSTLRQVKDEEEEVVAE